MENSYILLDALKVAAAALFLYFLFKALIKPTSMIIYTIKAGEHYCDKRTLRYVSGSEMKGRAVFDPSALYSNRIASNATDINKLVGFREGLSEDNSARIGWNCRDGRFLLYPYVHANGVNLGAQDPAPITSVAAGEEFDWSIKISGSTYTITVNGVSVLVPRGRGSVLGKYMLYPYFGGDEPAPHDIRVGLQLL